MKINKLYLSYTTPILISLLAPIPYSIITGTNIANIKTFLIFSATFYIVNLLMILFYSIFAGKILKAQTIGHADENYWMVDFINQKSLEVGLKKSPRVFLKESEIPNAYALGYKFHSVIIVERPLLKFSRECIEGVLAHELAHIELGHTFTINFIANFFEIPKFVFSLYLFAISLFFELGGIVIPFVRVMGAVMVKAYEVIVYAYISVLRFFVNIIFNILNRHQEKEADLRAIRTTGHLGIIEYFEWASQFDKKKFIKLNFDTHPANETRIDYCVKEARSLGIFNGEELTSGI